RRSRSCSPLDAVRAGHSAPAARPPPPATFLEQAHIWMMSADRFISGPPEGCRPDWTIDQDWAAYTPGEHRVWVTLYERQAAMLPGRACDQFLKGLEALDLH